MRRLIGVVVLLFLMLALSSPVLGAEGKAGPDVSPRMVLVQNIFDIIWKVAIPLLFAWLAKKGYDKNVLATAERCVEMGVSNAYENFVRPLKQDKEEHPDGKLKDGERKDAKRWAMNKAIEFATGGPKRMLLRWGAEGIGNLIEKVITRRKKRKSRDA